MIVVTICVFLISCKQYKINKLGNTLPEKNHSEVKSMKKYFTSFKSLNMSTFWYKILSSIDRVILNSLALLSMENELASTINFDDIITEFDEFKARKIKF